jgi:hypothetical protein
MSNATTTSHEWNGFPCATRRGRDVGSGPFTTGKRRTIGALLLAALAAAACVDGPTGASPVDTTRDPLAETFEALARVAGEFGDLARSDGFAHAALAVRSGIAPSRLEVQFGSLTEVYDAYVTSVQWDSTLVGGGMRPPARRSLVGWRKTAEGSTRVIALGTPSDSAAVLSPVALGAGISTVAVFAGATAMMNEGRDTPQGRPDMSNAWYATGGWVKLRESAIVRPCPTAGTPVSSLGMTRCDEARYLVRFDLAMQRLAGRPMQVVAGVPPRRAGSVGEQVVSGARMRLACLVPSGQHGCR